MKKKTFKYPRLYTQQNELIEELQMTEKEFGTLITEKWDWVKESSQLQKKALQGAKKLKTLRLMLISHKVLNRTVQ